MQSVLYSPQNSRHTFIFRNLVCAYIQPVLQYPPNTRSPFSAIFHLPIPLLLIHKIILTIENKNSFLYKPAFFCLPIFAYSNPCNLYQMYFLYLRLFCKIKAASRDEWAREPFEDWHYFNWHCFNLSLLSQSIDKDNRVYNHLFLIVVVSDEVTFNQNGIPWHPPSTLPSTYFHRFHTLLIPSKELTSHYNSVAWLDFHS